jgi:hypothetical protein
LTSSHETSDAGGLKERHDYHLTSDQGLKVPVPECSLTGFPPLGKADGVGKENAGGRMHSPSAIHELGFLKVWQCLMVGAEPKRIET